MSEERIDPFRPMPKQINALAAESVLSVLAPYRGWTVETGQVLTKTFNFDHPHEVQAFVNAVMWVSLRQNHHPELLASYRSVTLRYTTHDFGDQLTQRDLLSAMKVETLLQL